MKVSKGICLAAVAALLSACGAQDNSSVSSPSVSPVLRIAGAQSPDKTAAGLIPDVYKAEQLDSTNVSRVYWDVDGTASNIVVALRNNNPPTSNCAFLTGCTISSGPKPEDVPYTVTRMDLFPEDWNAVMTKNGITTIAWNGKKLGGSMQSVSYDADAYGSWMDYSGFAVFNTKVNGDYNATAQFGMASGDLHGRAPKENYKLAEWSGLMVGSPTSGKEKGDRLQGNAKLTYNYHANSPTVDVAFTEIKNLDRLRNHSETTINFNNVPVGKDGTFISTTKDIQGAFYSRRTVDNYRRPDEVAGVFNTTNIVGAFGGKRDIK